MKYHMIITVDTDVNDADYTIKAIDKENAFIGISAPSVKNAILLVDELHKKADDEMKNYKPDPTPEPVTDSQYNPAESAERFEKSPRGKSFLKKVKKGRSIFSRAGSVAPSADVIRYLIDKSKFDICDCISAAHFSGYHSGWIAHIRCSKKGKKNV